MDDSSSELLPEEEWYWLICDLTLGASVLMMLEPPLEETDESSIESNWPSCGVDSGKYTLPMAPWRVRQNRNAMEAWAMLPGRIGKRFSGGVAATLHKTTFR
jgi:hypothetical protein